MDAQAYYGIGLILVVAAVVYYSVKTDSGNRNVVKAKEISVEDAKSRIGDLIRRQWNKKIDWKERKSYHARGMKFGTGDGSYDHFYGVIAQVYQDDYDREGETVRVIWNRTDDCEALSEGLPPDMESRDANTDPFYGYIPLRHIGTYVRDDGRHHGQVVNIGRMPDFSSPQLKKDEGDSA